MEHENLVAGLLLKLPAHQHLVEGFIEARTLSRYPGNFRPGLLIDSKLQAEFSLFGLLLVSPCHIDDKASLLKDIKHGLAGRGVIVGAGDDIRRDAPVI